MTIRLSSPLLFALVLSCALATRTSQASTVRALSLRGLVEHADAVVRGRALEITPLPDQQGRIVRRVVFSVESYIAGVGPREIAIRLSGGKLAGRGRLVPGEAELQLDKPVILFLERAPNTDPPLFYVVGMAQGLFFIVDDAATKQSYVTRTLGNLNLIGEPTDDLLGLSRAETSTFIPYDEFIEAIAKLAALK